MQYRSISLSVSLVLMIAATAPATVVTQYSFENDLLDSALAGTTLDTLTPITVGAGAESYDDGIVGRAVRVDTAAGSAFALRAPTSADLNLASNWTLEAFVKPDTQNTGEWDRFWTKWAEGSNDWHFAFRYANNGLDFFENGTQRFDGGTNAAINTVPLNSWSHVAVVGDGATIKGYIDGNEVVSASYVAPGAPGASNMNFGNFAAAAPNALQFTGLIDEALIHDAAVTPTYLQNRAALIPPPGTDAPPTTGLVSYWDFDGSVNDVAGAFAANIGTAADDLTPRGGAANFEPGQIGQALRIGVAPGDTTDLFAALSADVNLPATYTVEGWVKPTELSDSWQRLVLNWGGEQAYHFAIRNNSGLNNAVSLFHAQSDGAQPNANGGTVVLNEWQHIAGVADGTNLIVYLNGEAVAIVPYDGTIHTATTEGLGIGDSATARSSIKFNGLLDDLAIWSVPLTPEQIRFQYQAGLEGNNALFRGRDDIIPEPATVSLGLLGIGGLMMRRRRSA